MQSSPVTENLTKRSLIVAHDLTNLAVSVLGATQATQSDRHRIFAIAATVRSLNYFRAVVVLIESRLYEPAGAALRVMLELMFVLKAVQQTPDLLDSLATQAFGESRKAMGALAKVSQDSRPDWLTDELIQAELAGFDSKHQGFNAAFWAEKSGDTEIYNTMYRRLNSFSHGSLGALNAYLPVDGNNQFTSVISDVGKGYASQFLVSASSILLEELQMIDGAHGRNGQCGEFARFGVLLHQIQEQIVSTSDIRPPA